MHRLASAPLLHCLLLGLALSLAANAWVDPGNVAAGVGGSGGAATREATEDLLVRAARREGLDRLPAVRGRLARLATFLDLVPAGAREDQRIRAARALGLTERDPVIRRYLADAMRARLASRAKVSPPSEAEIAAYIARRPDDFRHPARIQLRHTYVGGFSERARERASRLAARALRGGETFDSLIAAGDVFYGGHVLPPLTRDEISRRFGSAFAGALHADETGWLSRPIESAYGLHVVEVVSRTEPLPESRSTAFARARRSLLQERSAEAVSRGIDALRARERGAS